MILVPTMLKNFIYLKDIPLIPTVIILQQKSLTYLDFIADSDY